MDRFTAYMHRIEYARQLRRYSIKELAEKAKVSVSTLRRWQTCPTDHIQLQKVLQVCDALSITPSVLVCPISNDFTPESRKFLELYLMATPDQRKFLEEELSRLAEKEPLPEP